MARQQRNQAAAPQDNRARMQTFGEFAPAAIPDPSAIEASAVQASENVQFISMGNPALPTVEEGQSAPAQPTEQPPAPQQPPAAEQPAPVEDPVRARFRQMTPEQREEAYANLEHLRGKMGEEVGTYRKLFDKMMDERTRQPISAQPQPVAPAPAPEDESALVTEILTSPKKFMQRTKEEMRRELEAERAQEAIKAEMQKHQQTLQTPEFQKWLVNVPRHLVEQADRDPNTFQWLMGQFRPAASQPTTPQAAPVAQAQPSTPGARVVNLGPAAGGPSAATRPDTTKPTFTRTELAQMYLERPEEYRRREEEINLAYLEGRVR
jgi:hypothetical protein